MKSVLLFLAALLVQQSVKSATWIVDNNINSPQPIKSVQDAIDNYASSGDTIMVEGSPASYGDFTVSKPLTLIGEGSNDNLIENTIAGLIWITSSNVFITGFNLIFGVPPIRIGIEGNFEPESLSNITVERCVFPGFEFFGPRQGSDTFHNIFIRNNIIRYGLRTGYGSAITMDTLILENNLLVALNFEGWGYNVTGGNTIFIRNNVFINTSSPIFYNGYWNSHLTDAIVSNNIFYAANPQGCNCTYMNNLTYGNGSNDTLPGPQNNNIYSQDPLFVNYPGGDFNYSYDFALKAGSPCIMAGIGGTDMGIKGGYFPYAVGEGPKIPVVDFVNLSSSAVAENKQVNLQFDAHIRK